MESKSFVQGRGDGMEHSLVHQVSVAWQQRTKFMSELAAIFDFELYSSDVTQAYLQISERLMREVYPNPLKEKNSQRQLINVIEN